VSGPPDNDATITDFIVQVNDSSDDLYIGTNADEDVMKFNDDTTVEFTVPVTGTSLTVTGALAGLIPTTTTTDATLVVTTAGARGYFYAGGFAQVITIDVADGVDIIYLDGVALTAGYSIDSAGGAGDFICLIAVDATNWHTLGRSGTWIDGGA